MADAVGDNTPTNEAMSVDIPCLMHCNGQDSQTQLPVQLAQPVPMESVKNHILQLVTEGIGSPRNPYSFVTLLHNASSLQLWILVRLRLL